MVFLALVLLGVFALGPQVVLSGSFKFKFAGPIEQCKPASISFFHNDKAGKIPVTLTLIPFGSKPYTIPIPSSAVNSTGVSVTFLPLPADTRFVASLDDDEGDNSAKVSDVFRVVAAADGSNNSSCLPSPPGQAAFTLVTDVANMTQCENFQVRYALGQKAPTIRSFSPNGNSQPLNLTSDDTDSGVATYTMKQVHGMQTVLMMYDDQGPENGVTTPLITVAGDATSSSDCLPNFNSSSTNSKVSSSSSGGSSLSKGAIIGIGVSLPLVFLIAILVALYFIRERRRKRRLDAISFDPALLEKQSYYSESKRDFQSPPPFTASDTAGFTRNPAYTTGQYSPTRYSFARTNSAQSIPDGLRAGPPQRKVTFTERQLSHSSINPFDIEGMLDYAANGGSSRGPTPPPNTLRPSVNGANPRTLTTRRTSGDAPLEPHSRTVSAASNPFGEKNAVVRSPSSSSRRSNSLSSASSREFEITRPPLAATGLPSSPRNALEPPKSRFSAATASAIDDGGIGAFPQPSFARNSLPRDSVSSWGNTTGIAR